MRFLNVGILVLGTVACKPPSDNEGNSGPSPRSVTAAVTLDQSSADVLADALATAISKKQWAAVELGLADDLAFTKDGAELGSKEFVAALRSDREFGAAIDDTLTGMCSESGEHVVCYRPGNQFRVTLAQVGDDWVVQSVKPVGE